MVLWEGLKLVITLTLGQTFHGKRLAKLGIHALTLVAVMATINFNNRLARTRGDQVVSAIKEYKARHDRYPDALQGLVPDFLPSVPKAKYALAFNEFYYRYSPGELLRFGCFVWPPFAWSFYDFERNRWRSVG